MRPFDRTFARIRTVLAALVLGGLALAAQATTTDIYYHNDLAGTPLAATDGSGNVLWRQSYKPYGERLNPKAPAEQLPWYTGKAHVEAAGLSYYGARWYDPVLGRFMGVDPAGFSEANLHSFNRYAYANNNPYKFVDPDGKQAVPALAPPGRLMTAPPPTLAGRPSEQQQARQLEGFGSGNSMPSLSVPALGITDIVNFAVGGLPAVLQDKLGGLIYSESTKAGSLGANPFGGKSAAEIAEMLIGRGFEPRGPNPSVGRGTFVNPDTGRGYHIDANHGEPKGPHVGVHRPREARDTLAPRDYSMGGRRD